MPCGQGVVSRSQGQPSSTFSEYAPEPCSRTHVSSTVRNMASSQRCLELLRESLLVQTLQHFLSDPKAESTQLPEAINSFYLQRCSSCCLHGVLSLNGGIRESVQCWKEEASSYCFPCRLLQRGLVVRKDMCTPRALLVDKGWLMGRELTAPLPT